MSIRYRYRPYAAFESMLWTLGAACRGAVPYSVARSDPVASGAWAFWSARPVHGLKRHKAPYACDLCECHETVVLETFQPCCSHSNYWYQDIVYE